MKVVFLLPHYVNLAYKLLKATKDSVFVLFYLENMFHDHFNYQGDIKLNFLYINKKLCKITRKVSHKIKQIYVMSLYADIFRALSPSSGVRKLLYLVILLNFSLILLKLFHLEPTPISLKVAEFSYLSQVVIPLQYWVN